MLYDEESDGTGTITAITVTENALFYNGNTLESNLNITNILTQAEQVTFTFDDVLYILTVVDINFIPMSPGFSFYLFQVESETSIPDITDADLTFQINVADGVGYNTPIFFSPLLTVGNYINSDYNPLINNGNVIRRSTLRVEADRFIGNINSSSPIPSNFEAILNNNATKAQVQDSFYTDTGITNARYRGSKATPSTFSNTNPAISANEFIGDIHPDDASLQVVCTYNNSDRVYQPLLHTGPNRLPGYNVEFVNIKVGQQFNSGDITLNYSFQNSSGINVAKTIDPGDLLIMNPASDPPLPEVMRVLEHNTFNKILVVQRGYLSTSQNISVDVDTLIYKIQRTDVFKIDNFIRNLSAIENSMIYEKESHSVLFTDGFGLVYRQSICPDPDSEITDVTVDDPSDRRLKYNIKLIGKSPSNTNIYSFEYKDKEKFGYGTYQGVMSDEINKKAVSVDKEGYDRVNYSLLDVEFKKIKD